MRKVFLLASALLCRAILPAHAFDPLHYGSPIFASPQIETLFVQGGGMIAPLTIYRASYPGVNFSDSIQVVLDVPAGATQENLSVFGAYMRTKSGNAKNNGAAGNAIGHFATGFIDADNSAMWGVNTLITDNSSRTAASGGSGRVAIGAELDFNIMRPTTELIGASIGGNSLAQPTNANGFLVNSLGAGIRWGTGFWVLDGTADRGLVLGASAVSGTNKVGIPIWLQAFDSNGTKRTGVIRQDGGFITMADITQGTWPGVRIWQGDISLDAGHGIIVNGKTVLSGRQDGWTQGTGTPNLGGFAADYTQTISETYSQAQVQRLQDQLLATQQRVLALENALRAHGLIGQ
ncbi:hypothetical protein [Methylobacterium brachiatum]|uniref:hypothetical protein n=1 Tax=Methylobacterium brachiatum TaxID=269660 RepID=UPI0024479025|nr:hypothetical protein [Methylobacterium brachiatum]MDH2310392.1 hypothetical protein [Methylobacterium brachiatum]